MLSVKVTGTILGAACQLTFIKQAIKQQITGLYGFIMPAMQDHSPGLRGEGGRAGSGEAGRMLAGQPGSRGGLLSQRLSPCPCLLRIEDHLTPLQPRPPRNPKQNKQKRHDSLWRCYASSDLFDFSYPATYTIQINVNSQVSPRR